MPRHVSGKQSSQTRQIDKSRVHEFRGQNSAEMVIKWLKQPGIPLTGEVQKLIQFSTRLAGGDLSVGQEIVEHIADTVAKWKLGWAPVASFSTLDGLEIKWKPIADTRTVPPALWDAYWHAVQLLEQGLLHRIRQCARPGCEEWFFGKFDHQNFHSDACRIASLSTDEQRKEARRKYMRDLRAKKKLKKFRSSKKGGK
jgi:hypothetical protein